MRKFIHADKGVTAKLKAIFKCSDRTIRNALTYDENKGNSDLCKKIRFTALQYGCHTYTVNKEGECFHDEADRIMWCLYPNGAKVSFDKVTGVGEIFFKGDVVARYDNVQLTDIPEIQAKARAY
ncbi:MAG: hypothetical protein K2N05_11385 [Muribaculaceae bacterium]|nr:hypothetical protein [Muribaculaceae bacterium]